LSPPTVAPDAALQLLRRHAVTDVMAAYAAGVDRRDWPLVRSCFEPDAHVRGTRLTAAFADYFPHLCAELTKFERTTHFLGTQRVEVTGDTAWLETYAVARHFWRELDSSPRQLTIGVRYTDDLRCTSDVWVITRRVVDLDWSDAGPLGPDVTWTTHAAVDAGRDGTAS
jgi:SnoaL-like domain